MTIGLSHPLWSLSNRTADGIHQAKKSMKHVGEPVWILACSLIYLSLPAFLGPKIQEYVMRAFPCPSGDLYEWADRGKSQNEVDILPLQGSALSETAVSFDWGVAIWKLGHISQERRARVGCWKEPRAGVSDAPGSDGDCLSFPVGTLVHLPPPYVGFLICKVRRLFSKVFFSAECVCVSVCLYRKFILSHVSVWFSPLNFRVIQSRARILRPGLCSLPLPSILLGHIHRGAIRLVFYVLSGSLIPTSINLWEDG